MNKPIQIEARGKKKDRRQQNHGPSSELAVLGDQTQQLASEENQERQRADLAEQVASAVPMVQEANLNSQEVLDGVRQSMNAQAPFPGMEREWTADEKAGMNTALKQYGWQEGTPPVAVGADAIPDLSKMTEADGQIIREQFAEVNGIQPTGMTTEQAIQHDKELREEAPAGLMLASNLELISILEQARMVVGKGLPKDMKRYVHDLINTLASVPVSGPEGAFDAEYAATQAYYQKNLILVVTRETKPIPGIAEGTLKRMLELYPISITGLSRNFSLPSRGMSHAQVRFDLVKSMPKMVFGEKYGRVFGDTFETWARRVADLGVNANSTIDFMLIEPDPTHTCVIDAWKCTEMYPGDVFQTEGLRDITTYHDKGMLEVHFRGEVARGQVINLEAKALLDEINVRAANPYEAARLVDAIVKSGVAQ